MDNEVSETVEEELDRVKPAPRAELATDAYTMLNADVSGTRPRHLGSGRIASKSKIARAT
jgi:hypothetical protein